MMDNDTYYGRIEGHGNSEFCKVFASSEHEAAEILVQTFNDASASFPQERIVELRGGQRFVVSLEADPVYSAEMLGGDSG